jgi:hypothetical protein
MVKKTGKSYRHIERRYILTSKELKKRLDIEGQVQSINLWKGRSPNDIKKGKSADFDKWEINTTEQGFDGKEDNLPVTKKKEVPNSSHT